MRYRIICCRRMRIDGHHEVWRLLIEFTQTTQVQRYPEPPKVDVLQGDRLGDDTQGVFFAIEFDIVELLLQRPQFRCDPREARHIPVSSVQ